MTSPTCSILSKPWTPPHSFTIKSDRYSLLFVYNYRDEKYYTQSQNSLRQFLSSEFVPLVRVDIPGSGSASKPCVGDSSSVILVGEYAVKIAVFDDSELESFEFGDTPRVFETIKTPEISRLVVPHTHVVNNHIILMKRCDNIMYKHLPAIHERILLEFVKWSVDALGLMARHGLEFRNFKFSSVAMENNTFMFLDPSQILDIRDAHNAVCTYPACASYTFGNDCPVGLAATAWAFVSSIAIGTGMDWQALAHQNVNAQPQLIVEDNYASPVFVEDVLNFLSNTSLTRYHSLRTVFARAIDSYSRHFQCNGQELTYNRAVKDAISFYNELCVLCVIAKNCTI